MTTTERAAPSERTTVKRRRERAVYERDAVNAIVDEALICHIAFVSEEGHPVVLPTIHARIDDTLYVHGSVASHMLRTLGRGGECCVNLTIIDGLVLARSAFHQSMNYRSVVVYATPRIVDSEEETLAAMRSMNERLVPGRWDDLRPPSAQELAQTTVIALPLDEASAKVREGAPRDLDEDVAESAAWAGVLPYRIVTGEPVADAPTVARGAPVPDYLRLALASATHSGRPL